MLDLRIPVYPCDAGADTVDENAVFVRKLRRDPSCTSHKRGVTSIAAAALYQIFCGLVRTAVVAPVIGHVFHDGVIARAADGLQQRLALSCIPAPKPETSSPIRR